jgi:hypothetical protein
MNLKSGKAVSAAPPSSVPFAYQLASGAWVATHHKRDAQSSWTNVVFREPTGHRQRNPQDGAELIEDTQAVCGFRCLASKRSPFFQTINVMAAILRPNVRRAISGRILWATRS